ncbi:hypothetical protein BC828DRAFT_293840 [Blastocladiella britannica]|nr:hypothetical protein BC828DRAFT_293840 [Blastocladiella britannica]
MRLRLAAPKQHSVSPTVQLHNQSTYHPLAVPDHLRSILTMTLRASLTSSIESAQQLGSTTLRPVKVLIANGSEDVSFKFSDKGVGMTQRQLAQVFNFGLVAAPSRHRRLPPLPFQLERHPTRTPDAPTMIIAGSALERPGTSGRSLAPPMPSSGAGGLVAAARSLFSSFRSGTASKSAVARPMDDAPLRDLPSDTSAALEGEEEVQTIADMTPRIPPAICRLLQQHAVPLSIAREHARYFGGDLEIVSMEAWGSDAYVHVPKSDAATGSSTCSSTA